MRAEVIDMRSVSRVARREEAKDFGLAAFRKAQEAEKLSTCRTFEILTAVENRVSAGMLSEREADALCSYYGFEVA